RGPFHYVWKIPVNCFSINDPIYFDLYGLHLFTIFNLGGIAMELVYKYNEKLLDLKESINGEDIEFNIFSLGIDIKKQIFNIQEYFNRNDILTDILVYTHAHKKYQIIVRIEFYTDFVLQLFKQQLLQEIKWV
ncbi:MAG: hypothetical protein ACXVNF_02250, partial [Neobacillus sp.]